MKHNMTKHDKKRSFRCVQGGIRVKTHQRAGQEGLVYPPLEVSGTSG